VGRRSSPGPGRHLGLSISVMAVAAERIVDITRARVCEAPPTYRSEPNRIRRAGCRWHPSVEHLHPFLRLFDLSVQRWMHELSPWRERECLKRHFSSADSI
jgi:hypothetical protein